MILNMNVNTRFSGWEQAVLVREQPLLRRLLIGLLLLLLRLRHLPELPLERVDS